MKRSSPLSMVITTLVSGIGMCTFTAEGTLTGPYYSYADIYAEQGYVSQDGSAGPGQNGEYSTAEDEGAVPIFLAHGYRWWFYSGECYIFCGSYPSFDFPGSHALTPCPGPGCANPPIAGMSSWAGVTTDPEAGTIAILVGAANAGGPTADYCIPQGLLPPICFPPPSRWGVPSTYGYIR